MDEYDLSALDEWASENESSHLKEIHYSCGNSTFDNMPKQLVVPDFDTFASNILARRCIAKGQYYFCSSFKKGTHPDTTKYPQEAHYRLNTLCKPRRFLPLDFDGFRDPNAFEISLKHLHNYKGFGYTTASHTDEKPRLRVVLELSREVSREEGILVGKKFQNLMELTIGEGTAIFDDCVYRGEQPCYGPLTQSKTFYFKGSIVDVDNFLSKKDSYNAEFRIENYDTKSVNNFYSFPLERLGAAPRSNLYPYTPENAIEFLNAAKAAYPNGLPDRSTYFELGMALAELVVVHKWPKIEARKILDDVGSKPAGANKDNNDSEWENYLASTSARIKQGDPITGHRSVVAKARANGWKPKIQTDEIPEWLNIMNENLFVAPYSNTVAVFRKQDGAYIPLRSEAFKLLYSNKTVEVQSSIGSKRTPIADAWLKHQNRREYSGVGFWPAVKAPSGKFNKWQGWNVVPSHGEVSPALNHIKKVICNNDQSLYAFVIGWLANCVQHPNEQGHVALVIMGGRGTGKTMFAEWIKSIFGRHSMSIANSKLLTGDFTGHLEELVFLVAEEAFWAGDKAAENSLKHAITGSTLTVHHKGFAPYDAPNYLHVIMTSNEEWVIPAGVDERRFAVCTVSDIHKGDVEYFKNLALWASNGGISALLEYLLNYDLMGFNVRTPPDTEGLRNQKMMSLDPTTRWIIHRLEVGAFVGNEWKQDVSANAMVNSLCEHQQLNTHERRRAETLLGSTLRKIFKGLKKIRQRNGNTRETLYRIPVTNINEARELFEIFMGIDGWSWGDDE